MRDTVVALSSAPSDGEVFFAKNSDREPNKAQFLELVQGNRYQPGSQAQCTFDLINRGLLYRFEWRGHNQKAGF
jgi:dipeptidase